MKQKETHAKRRPNKTTLAIEFDNEDLERLRQIKKTDERSVGYLVRRATKFWLESADAKELSRPQADRLEEAISVEPAAQHRTREVSDTARPDSMKFGPADHQMGALRMALTRLFSRTPWTQEAVLPERKELFDSLVADGTLDVSGSRIMVSRHLSPESINGLLARLSQERLNFT